MRRVFQWTLFCLALGLLLITFFVSSGCGGGTSQTAPPPPPPPPPPADNPVPAISSLSASSAPAGWPGIPLLINGSGFVATTTMRWNGGNRASRTLSSSVLKTSISLSDLRQSGIAQVTVFNPAPGGGTSNATNFTIQAVAAGAVGIVERSSVATDLTEANSPSTDASMTADGRYIAFTSFATNLGGTGNSGNVFLRDTCVGAPAGCTPSVSRISAGTRPSMSSTGRYVAFISGASNLVPGDTNGFIDVFVRDTCMGVVSGCTPATTMVSLDSAGNQILLDNTDSSISDDGRFVAFTSGMTQNYYTLSSIINLRDTCTGAPTGCLPTTTQIDVGPNGESANGQSSLPIISSSGRYLAFASSATNLVTPNIVAPLPVSYVFLRDLCLGAPGCTPSTILVSSDRFGNAPDAHLTAMSADGRFVVFDSWSGTFVQGDTNGFSDVFVRDTCNGAPPGCVPSTRRVSQANDGSEGNDHSYGAIIGTSARFIVFNSSATNLVAGDTNGNIDVFLRDTCIGATTGCAPSTVRLSVALDGTQSNQESYPQEITTDGRYVVLVSKASTLAPSDTNDTWDVFVARTNVP